MANKKNTKTTVETISVEQFETLALEEAHKNGMGLDYLTTSFNRFRSFNDEFAEDKTTTVFNVAYTEAGVMHTGQSTSPKLAIAEAINKRNIELGKHSIVAESTISHEEQAEQ